LQRHTCSAFLLTRRADLLLEGVGPGVHPRYGPFVMNTREEIEQALDDLHADTFI